MAVKRPLASGTCPTCGLAFRMRIMRWGPGYAVTCMNRDCVEFRRGFHSTDGKTWWLAHTNTPITITVSVK